MKENQLSAVEQLILLHKYLVIEVFSLSGWPILINNDDCTDDVAILHDGDQPIKSKKSSPRSLKIPSHKFNHSASVDSISSSSKGGSSSKKLTATSDQKASENCDVSVKKEKDANNKYNNLNSSKQKLAKKQNSLLGNLSRKLKKCFNANSSAITSGGEPDQELLTEHSQLLSKVEKTLASLNSSVENESDRRFVAAKVDINLKPNYFNEMIRNYLETAERKYCEELHHMSRRCRSCNEISCSCRVGFRERNSKPQTLPRDMKIDNNAGASGSSHLSSSTSPVCSKQSHNVNVGKSYNRPGYNTGVGGTGVDYGANRNARSESTDGGNRINAYYESRVSASRTSGSSTGYQTRSQVNSCSGSSGVSTYHYASSSHTSSSTSSASSPQVYRPPSYSSSQISSSAAAHGPYSGGSSCSSSSQLRSQAQQHSLSENSNRRRLASNPTFPPHSTTRVIPSTVITKCKVCRRSVEGTSICNNCISRQIIKR